MAKNTNKSSINKKTKKKSSKAYRKNVGIIVFNNKGEILIGQRYDYPKYYQFPQGGIDKNESPLEAAHRELKEETGISLIGEAIYITKSWLYYDFPNPSSNFTNRLQDYQGQMQKWFLFFYDNSSLISTDESIDEFIDKFNCQAGQISEEKPEFRKLIWSDFNFALKHVLPFKKKIYLKLQQEISEIIQNYLALEEASHWGNPRKKEDLSPPLKQYINDYFSLSLKEQKENQVPTRLPKKFPPETQLTKTQIKTLSSCLHNNKNDNKQDFSIETALRIKNAYGKSFAEVLSLRQAHSLTLPDAVIFPRTETEICKIIHYANSNKINGKKIGITVRGGASSVTDALALSGGGLVLNLSKNFNKIISFDPIDSKIRVEPGLMGPKLEEYLRQRGFSCGHFPQSFEYSSVGGWVASGGAGQESTGYGRISDMVLGLRIATARGIIPIKDYPAAALGPELRRIFIGSEGNFGIITEITLKVHRLHPISKKRFFSNPSKGSGATKPQKKKGRLASFLFKDFATGLETMRLIMQGGFGYPHFFRLQDPEETEFGLKMSGKINRISDSLLHSLGYCNQKRSLMHLGAYGDIDAQALIISKAKKIARKRGALSLGAKPLRNWLTHRYSSAYLRDAFLDRGLIIDSIETVSTWKKLPLVWKNVRAKIKKRNKTICLCHISHCYENGASLYFIFITRLLKNKSHSKNIALKNSRQNSIHASLGNSLEDSLGDSLEDFLNFQSGIIDTIVNCGAAISHHHGIGRAFAPWLEGEISKVGVGLLSSIKNFTDPNEIFHSKTKLWGL